jgi:hypothetical protein
VFRVAAAARLDQQRIWCTRGVFQRDHHGGNFGSVFGPTRQSGLGGDGGLLVAVTVRSFLVLLKRLLIEHFGSGIYSLSSSTTSGFISSIGNVDSFFQPAGSITGMAAHSSNMVQVVSPSENRSNLRGS